MTDSRATDASRALVARLQGILERRTSRPVALKETHISWVLLTDRLALKLKKPLRLPFLDFGTAALRRRACEEELRLNRRLAPGLYRRVLPVRGTRDAPTFGGIGADIDAVVCMRRFPDGALLGERIAAGRLLPWHVGRLAVRIARFHEAAEVVRDDGGDAAERAANPVEALLAQLAATQPASWNAMAARWLAGRRLALAPAWRERLASGAIRECHGDLHLANAVVLGEDVTAFDCIEFDPALGRIDVMSDVAFMTMDLQAHGRPDQAHRFLDAYLEGRGDHGGLRVLRFYEVCRALVRALVARLSPPAARGDAPDYLGLATRWMTQPDETPRLAILCGLAGSGKSTLAGRLVQDTGASGWFGAAVVRRRGAAGLARAQMRFAWRIAASGCQEVCGACVASSRRGAAWVGSRRSKAPSVLSTSIGGRAMKILIAADGSDYTRRMLDYLASHEWLRSGHVLSVLAVVFPLPHRAAAFASEDIVQTYYFDDAEQVLRPIREFLKTHGIEAECVYRIGHPAECIAHAAQDGGHDLVVMGSHGHGAVASLVLGSVATKVIASCKTPVLLVR